MLEKIKNLKQSFASEITDVSNASDLEQLRIKYLGRKDGLITVLFEQFKQIDVESKRKFGPDLNELKSEVEQGIRQKEMQLLDNISQDIDLTIPGIEKQRGHYHPITLIQRQIEGVFKNLGFDVMLGPEIESDYYNFEALNIPEFHPARDMQDTFYLDLDVPKKEKGKQVLLRTHISNMQVRFMEQNKPPFAVVLPGRVFRNEALDASHEHSYQYMEGVVVGKDISYSQMAWTLDFAMKQIFGQDVKTKLLPSYFPFVEPGAEMAISCLVCKGKGCSVCKQTGWVEILGCGMVHQKVFEYAGYKKNEYQGFAFGFGLSRLALMKYSIPDIRMFAENDLRFLNQF